MLRGLALIGGIAVLIAGALVVGWYALQLSKDSVPEAASQPAPQPAPGDEIVLPDAVAKDKTAALSQEVLVSEEKKRDAKRAKLTGYIQDDKLPGGTLRGACFVPFEKPVQIHPTMPLELKGESAVRDPQPGEVEYFENRPPLKQVWLGQFDKEKKRYGVRGALVIIKGVAAGKAPNLDSISFLNDFRSHDLVAQKPQGRNVVNPSWANIGVAPPGELVRLLNLTLFPSDFVIRRDEGDREAHAKAQRRKDGDVVQEIKLPGYGDAKHSGMHYGATPGMVDPPAAEFPRIREPGLYTIACRRHPWQKAYFYVPDSPYIAMSDPDLRHPARSGEFVIAGIPPGRYTVEVWHPEYEPLKSTHEVEILPDVESELGVAFKTPLVLSSPPQYPTKPIAEWAFVGPFDPLDDAADAEVRKLQFDAAYDGKYRRVGWEKVTLPNKGNDAHMMTLEGRWDPRADAVSYAAARIDSPSAQKLLLRVWANYLSLQVVLNGKSIYYSADADELGRRYERDISVLVAGGLKPGPNVLLVRMKGPARGGSLCVNYLCDGADFHAPEIRGTIAAAEAKGSTVLTDTTHWRCHVTRGPLRINPKYLKDDKWLDSRRDFRQGYPGTGLKLLERDTKALYQARNIDWAQTDWRDKALWFPFDIYYQSPAQISMVPQTPPPGDWVQPEFDDGQWMNFWYTPTTVPQSFAGFFIWNWHLRTDFVVPDNVQPSDLTLRLAYHGGARVLVNGAEVARGHLPQGQLAPETMADEYAEEAYMARPEELAKSPLPQQVPDLRTSFFDGGREGDFRGQSKALEGFRTPDGRTFLTKEGWTRIRKLRDRELGPVTIPAKLLRKGRNVLAVEVRGSPYHPDVYDGTRDSSKERHLHWRWAMGHESNAWSHAELLRLELRDPTGGVPSAMGPAKGLQVWVEDVHSRILNVHARPACSPAGTVRMVAALNGTYSGVVVLRSGAECSDLKITMSDLAADGKGPPIPASAMKVTGMTGQPLAKLAWLMAGGREAARTAEFTRAMAEQASQSPAVPKRQPAEDWKTWFDKVAAQVEFYDQIGQSLPQRLPVETAQPLWLALKVPTETGPGGYRGSLKVEAAGQPAVSVPVEVEVLGWRVPNPLEFKTDVWLEQHPYAIANQYLLSEKADAKPGERNWEGPVRAKVPLWSDKHFRLLEPSFRQLGRVGNDVLHIPVVVRTEFGNWQDSMIQWVRKKDGTLSFDYTVLDHYLDLAQKHLGRVRVVDFVVMHCVYNTSPSTVMVRDEATGKTEELNLGWTADASVRLPAWREFAASLIRHLKEKGLDHSVYWGHGGDYEPDPGLISYFYEVFPGTYWTGSGHSYHGGAGGGGHSRSVVRCFSDVYGAPKPLESAMGWKGPAIGNWGADVTWSGSNINGTTAKNFNSYRADESYLFVHNPRDWCLGPSVPLKWRTLPVHAVRRGYSGVGRVGLDGYQGDWMSGFKGMDWGFPGRPCNMLTWPGPEGAESTARFEAFIEGLQENEARIFLEQAMERGHVSKEVAAEARAALDDHVRPAMMGLEIRDGAADEYIYPWQAASRQLFRMASKVAELVGVDVNEPDVALKAPALGRVTRSFKIRNWTGKPREWKATASVSWIVPARSGGKLLGFEDFVFTVEGKDLKPGETVQGQIVITDVASGTESKFQVTAGVEAPVVLTYDHPHFNMTAGRSETREFRIVNRAIAEQDWQLAASVPWIKIEPASGKLKPDEELNLKLTASPPEKEAVHANELVLKAAGGLVSTKLASRTFVIPLLREKEGRAMPPGKITKIEDMAKQFTSGVFCKNGTIIETGVGVAGWGRAFTKKVENYRQLFLSPSYANSGVSSAQYLPLIGKEKFSRALWVYPHFEGVYNVEGLGITGFSACVGITRDARERIIRHHQYRANFEIWVDGQVRAQSGLMLSDDGPRYLTVEGLKDAKEFKLVTRLDCDKDDPTFLCTWADAQFYAEK